jgi:predicted DNA-binding antitoxin AbrB/MazE fold protein
VNITVDATFENGALKPLQPLPLQEHDRVRITVQMPADRVRQSQGLIGWKGAAEVVERVALDPLEDL